MWARKNLVHPEKESSEAGICAAAAGRPEACLVLLRATVQRTVAKNLEGESGSDA